jgi:hypothetical protein
LERSIFRQDLFIAPNREGARKAWVLERSQRPVGDGEREVVAREGL